MKEYLFIERYSFALEKWIACQIYDLKKGDLFFIKDKGGEYLEDVDGNVCFRATNDPYMIDGEYVVDFVAGQDYQDID